MDNTKIAVAIFDKLAKVYQEKFMDVGLYHQSFDLFCEYIAKENATVLELGCGPGNITKYLLEKRPNLKIMGTDLSPNMIALARINNPKAEFGLLDCREIHTIIEQYDAIMCGFCLPYLSKDEAVALIRGASKILNPNGIIYISTMEENEDNKSGLRKSSSGDEMYMYYHRTIDLTAALEVAGFKIITLRHQDFPTNDGLKTTDLIIIAQK
ncbi:MAG TPA: class I SAM-dependent methyltransferase [Flavobacterium sp.]|nr:class I SAM-dependent methyltransferase [Flavobacterium sp.]